MNNLSFNGPYGRFGGNVPFMMSIVDYIIGDPHTGAPANVLSSREIRTIAERVSDATDGVWYAVGISSLIQNTCDNVFKPLFRYSQFSEDEKDSMSNDLCDRLLEKLDDYSSCKCLLSKRTKYKNGEFVLCLKREDI